MNKNLKKVMSTIIVVTLVAGSISIYALAANEKKERNYEISTVKELKKELKSLKKEEKLDKKAQKKIVNSTSPEVLEAFIEEKTDDAIKAFNSIDVEEVLEETTPGKLYGKTTIDLGDGCEAIIEFEDGQDLNFLETINNLTSLQAYAATNGEQMWKDYGNRYFTAKSTVAMGIGYATLVLENHYTLSANGIDERYGEAYVDSSGALIITGTASAGNVTITDAYARTPGASNVNMYALFDIQMDGMGYITSQRSVKLSTTVKYVAINTSSKQIQVKHSWQTD